MAQDGATGGLNVSDSQGVQAGSGNTQHNYYGPPAASLLRNVSPHTAIRTLRGMPHSHAVSTLASAALDDITEILRVMIKADSALTAALLADVNQTRISELIEVIPEAPSWLDCLRRAAVDIGDLAAALLWDRDRHVGDMQILISDTDCSESFFRKYGDSLLCWRGNATIIVDGEIAEIYETEGGPRGALGPPETGALSRSLAGTVGTVQFFQRGYICASNHGAHAVPQPMLDAYKADLIGTSEPAGGWIGFPIASADVDEEVASQRFEHGMIFSSRHGAFPVRDTVVKVTFDEWPLTFPTSDENDATPSPRGTMGTLQHFRDLESDDPVVVYSSDKYGVQFLEGKVMLAHDRLGGTGGWLGFPTLRGGGSYPRGWWDFEGGAIYTMESGACFAVPRKTLNHIKMTWAEEELGWPVSEEYQLDDDSDRVQFFENGAFAMRNHRYEIFVRKDRPTPRDEDSERPRRIIAADIRERAGTYTPPPASPKRTAVPRSVPRAIPPAVPRAVEE